MTKAYRIGLIGYGAIGRQAASIFQKSSNITAMLALSTIGMDATRVCLVADPQAPQMQTFIEFKGDAREVRVHWQDIPLALNPSTSRDVPLNVIKAIQNMTSPVALGV
ncbi:MAG: DUF108 domain-containing protein [Anaerolineae bacterium]|nr:DUF108 domain-containing protein [Anaerolineae bacterium]